MLEKLRGGKTNAAQKVKFNLKKAIPFFIVTVSIAIAAFVALGGSDKFNAAAVPDCLQSQNSDFGCWSQRYKTLVDNSSTAEAFKDLKVMYPQSDFVRAQCHQITHVIGRAVADKSDDVGQAYKQGDSFCWSGYYHGVVEQIAKKLGSQNFIPQLNTICASVQAEQQYSFYHYNCVHGLGHGVMTITENELFESLKACDTVTDSWNRTSCYGGVFMENIMSDPATNPQHTTAYLRPAEPMYPCTAVEYQHKEQCYMMQSSYALRQVGQDFTKIFELCAAIEPEFQNNCYQSTGRDASGTSISDVAQTNTSCSLGTTEQQRVNCVIGAVKDFISYHHDDSKAKQLCDSFSEEAVKQACHTNAADYYKTF